MLSFRWVVLLLLCIVSSLVAGHKPFIMHRPYQHHQHQHHHQHHQYQPVQVTWLGHSAFEIVSSGRTNILIDPFIKDNPVTPQEKKNLSQYHPDAILVTHSHFDHLGDAVEIAKNSGAPIVITFDLAATLGVENVIGCNVGGNISIGDVQIHVVTAVHGTVNGSGFGYVLSFEDGRSLYHTGDTWITADMGFIQKLYSPSILLTCVGGGPYTQDPATAAFETRSLLFPSVIIPMHYGTFEGLATEQEVRDAFKNDPRLVIMNPGETRQF